MPPERAPRGYVEQILAQLSEKLSLKKGDINHLHEFWNDVLSRHVPKSFSPPLDWVDNSFRKFEIEMVKDLSVEKIGRLVLLEAVATELLSAKAVANLNTDVKFVIVDDPTRIHKSHLHLPVSGAQSKSLNVFISHGREDFRGREDFPVFISAGRPDPEEAETTIVLKAIADALKGAASELALVNDKIEKTLREMDDIGGTPVAEQQKGGLDGHAGRSA